MAYYIMGRSVREGIDVRLEGIAGRLVRDLHPRADPTQIARRIRITYGDDLDEDSLLLFVRDNVDDQEFFSSIGDYDDFRSGFPEGYPSEVPSPQPRPEFAGDEIRPAEKGRRGRRLFSDLPPNDEEEFLAEMLGVDTDELSPPPLDAVSDPFEEPPVRGPRPGRAEFANVPAFGKEWRVAIVRERGYFVLTGLDLTEAIVELKRLERGLLVGIPIALAVIGLGGWLVAERAMRPIRSIAEATSAVTADALDARIEARGHSDPEIEHLIEVLNEMMDRLEKSFSHATRFSSDVSHELKTPLAVMQGEIETALRECEAGSPEESRLLVLREETSRLKSITRSLMLLAQADVGALIRKSDSIDLSTELESIAEDAEIMAEQHQVCIEAEIDTGLEVRGDATLLRQALLNLVNNAVKYNEKNGLVRIEGTAENGTILIAVENTGPGIPSADRVKVFERFYRADKARSRGTDGFGLGLSLAKAVVEGHSGELQLARADEEITRFEVRLQCV